MTKKNNPAKSLSIFGQGPDELIGTTQVRELLGLSEARIQQFYRRNQLPGIKMLNRLLFRRADVEAFSKLVRPSGRKPSRASKSKN